MSNKKYIIPARCSECGNSYKVTFNLSLPDGIRAKSMREAKFLLHGTCTKCGKESKIPYVVSIPDEIENGNRLVSDNHFINCELDLRKIEAKAKQGLTVS